MYRTVRLDFAISLLLLIFIITVPFVSSNQKTNGRNTDNNTSGDLVTLTPHYEKQTHLVSSQITSITIVANALRAQKIISSPISSLKVLPALAANTHYYTQQALAALSEESVLIMFGKEMDDITRTHCGLQLCQLNALAKKLGLNSEIQPILADMLLHSGLYKTLKRRLISALNAPEKLVIINYASATSESQASPLAAYHASSDSFLVIDVSSTDRNSGWISSRSLFNAMTLADTTSPGGFIIISNPAHPQNNITTNY
ncbi:phytochelatin synthase family protein [Shewanella kaireitica]|uniref:phytochelatin synthase family protein n=1 Tax=Shewanella kaireitica TaxID=212021 RepID=UPI00200FD536|nr:phytochelatin synthase family protein [Shewanella kaireitica]MCL1093825.1 phytochelatin synthase family protein [Shewanella kaireitica]